MAHSGRHFKINYGVYALYLKDTYCGNIMYGRQGYTYQDGMIACFRPGQVAEAGIRRIFGSPGRDKANKNTR